MNKMNVMSRPAVEHYEGYKIANLSLLSAVPIVSPLNDQNMDPAVDNQDLVDRLPAAGQDMVMVQEP